MLCARHCFINLTSFISSNNSEEGVINTPFLQLRKLSQTEFKQCVQGCTTGVRTQLRLMQRRTHWKGPGCWERLRAGGRGMAEDEMVR